jgi:hypothetical protein
MTLVGGGAGNPGSTADTRSAARFIKPPGPAGKAAATVHVVDAGENTILTAMPVIIIHPMSQTVPGGSPVTFTAAASGIPAPAFQWQKGGVVIVGATGSSYTITHAGLDDAGSYTVIATNAAGAATSNAAVLETFVAPPSNAVVSIMIQ